MFPPQTLSVTELRTHLADHIKRAKYGAIYYVGSHRKPNAVLLGVDQFEQVAPPKYLLKLMLRAMAIETAHAYFCSRDRTKRGDIWHPGDPFGRAVSWLWKTGREGEVVDLVGKLIFEARELCTDRPKISLEDLLNGLPLATSGDGWGISDEESERMIEMLREEVPQQYWDVESE